MPHNPKSLQEAILYFADFENCRKFMMDLRWPDGKVRCPACGSEKVTYLENARLFKCYGDHPKPKFSLKVGTLFEDSAIPLDKWLVAMWFVVNCKNGISSYELARDLAISQKSAWHVLHRLRFALHKGSFDKLSGDVEVDETYIGGKARNMHKGRKRRVQAQGGRNLGAKVVVLGMLERGKNVRAAVIADRTKPEIQPLVRANIEAGSVIFADEYAHNWRMDGEYTYQVINHLESYVEGNVHTNTLENFWSLLKRGLHGTYVSVEPFHLFRYVDEQAFRYNNRKDMTDFDRFKLAASQIIGKRLTWNQVTGKQLDPQTALN